MNSAAKTGVGTTAYMAPEVLLGQPYNEKVDVFSFGVIAFEIFNRRLMASDYMNTNEWDESQGHAYRVAAGWRPPFPESTPPALAKLIDRCWAGTPALRPKMTEVVEVLREIEASGVVAEMDARRLLQQNSGCCSVM